MMSMNYLNFTKVMLSVGFLVRKRNSNKSDDGSLRYVTFECSLGEGGNRVGSTNTSLKP